MSDYKLALGAVGSIAAASLLARRGARNKIVTDYGDVDWSDLRGSDLWVEDPAGGRELITTGQGVWPMGYRNEPRRWFGHKRHHQDDPAHNSDRNRWVAWSVVVLGNLVGGKDPGAIVQPVVDGIASWTIDWAGNWYGASYGPLGGGGGHVSMSGRPVAVCFIRHELIHAWDNVLGGDKGSPFITDVGAERPYASQQPGSPLNEVIESVMPVYRRKVDAVVKKRERSYVEHLAKTTGLSSRKIVAGEASVAELLVAIGTSEADAVKLERGGFGITPFSMSYSSGKSYEAIGRSPTDAERELMQSAAMGLRVSLPFSMLSLPEHEREGLLHRVCPDLVGKKLRGYLMSRHEVAARVIDQVATVAWERKHGYLPPGLTPTSDYELPRRQAESLVEPLRRVLSQVAREDGAR